MGLDDAWRVVEDVANAAINVGANAVSGGAVGYNPNDGGITPNAGYAGRLYDEVSGEADKREDAYNSRVVAGQAAAQQKLMDEQNERARIADVNASGSARAIRNTALARSRNFSGSMASSDERDFLGL